MQKLTKKAKQYLDSLSPEKLARIAINIKASNSWLAENRPKAKPIELSEIVKRLFASSSRLSIEADSKTTKGSSNGYLTGILYLAPYDITGINICPFAKTCKKDCLFNSGRGKFASVSRARIVKTLAFLLDRAIFEDSIIKDIEKLAIEAEKRSMGAVVRLNGTSDLLIEKSFAKTLASYPDIQFYDYTKNPSRFKRPLPSNYDLTFSFDGVNTKASIDVLNNSGRVAVVFKNGLPASFLGYPVVDGDSTDLRFLDPGGVVVGLKAKGSAKTDLADDRFIIDASTDSRCNGVFQASKAS